MGKGRKSKYISKLTSKDQAFLKALRNVGYLNKTHIQDIGLTGKRITNFERDGLVERCAYLDRGSKEVEHVWRLTDKGKQMVSTQMNLDNFYKSSSARHDLALADRSLSITQEGHRWFTEADLRDRLHDRIERLIDQGEIARAEELKQMLQERSISPPDGAYVKNGQIIAVEIITSSYGQEEIQAKIEFCQEVGIQLEFIKI